MTRAELPPGWYPVAQLRRLRSAPITVQLAGAPLLASRTPDTMAHLTDARTGQAWPLAVSDGLLFARLGDDAGPFGPAFPLLPSPHSAARIDGIVSARLSDIAENILDTTHTSVVHQGYLRKASDRRSVEVHIESGPGWVTATYPPGAAPGGWGARLIGAHRYTIRDSFRAPAIAEVAYTDGIRPAFSARFYLTPRAAAETYVAAIIAIPGRGLVTAFKLAALRLFFLRILAEDRAILELITANAPLHDSAPLVYAPQDLLRPGIDAILSGRTPLALPNRIALRV